MAAATIERASPFPDQFEIPALPLAADATLPGPAWKYTPTAVKFDPSKHLAIEKPEWKKKLSDFGFDNKTDGISEIAATAPFRLFTDEAIRLMRNDLLSGAVQENHVYGWERAPYIVRGWTEKSKFVYDAWMNPEVIKALSDAAGIDVVPYCDYEIASTNIQLGPRGRYGVAELNDIPTAPLGNNEKLEASKWDSRPIDDWHYDGVPFVAVLMVSNTTGMVGGETAVQAKDGSIHVVPGPAMGKVVVMQGSKLRHAALRAQNCPERIAMVTALRARDPTVEDMSHLRNVFETSDMNVMGHQWLSYRLKVLEQRCKAIREKLDASSRNDVMRDEMIEFAKANTKWIDTTVRELFRDME